MTLIRTDLITQTSSLSPSENYQTYCGLDTMVTLEVFEELEKLFPSPPPVYGFARALQGPYLDIMQRGFLVDQSARRHAANILHKKIDNLNSVLQTLAQAAWGKPLNPRSPAQLKDFFYRAMRFPEIWISQKGEKRLSCNREALEKLDQYMYARPIVGCILGIRDYAKQLDVLETEIDFDGRFRASYNIAGTETGRPSSSTNAFGTGGNAQNIAPGLRFVFMADPGWKICVIDLEQVEARDVGWFCGTLLGDWSYLDSCENGDLHTNNAKRIWPELGWPGDPKGDRAVADRLFYRDFTYRDMAKRGSHLSNYHGSAHMASRALKVPIQIMETFRSKYITGPNAAFPCIAQWWTWTATQLQTKGYITTPFGRTRHFFGRPEDESTLREAIAFLPQSTTADRMNLGMWRVWKNHPEIQLLAQTYDSITFQYREGTDETELFGQILEDLKVELVHQGRVYSVPGEAKIGWNWGAKTPTNPGGLIKYSKVFPDTRTRAVGAQRIAY